MMNNFELIDDYLTNRLSDANKIAFEKEVASDPALRADVAMQKAIVESVKNARVAELKSMLNNVPIAGSSPFSLPMLKMAAGIVGAGLLIAALSYYFNDNSSPNPNLSTSLEDSIRKVDSSEFEPLEEPVAFETPKEEERIKESPNPIQSKKVSIKEPVKEKVVEQRPKLNLIDPSKDNSEENSNAPSKNEIPKSAISVSHIAVDVMNGKKYNFHYQFSSGKLLLYGSFDKSLYEILEINGENHSIFMFYKDQYFSLNEKQPKITLLVPIKDIILVSKLKEYRGR